MADKKTGNAVLGAAARAQGQGMQGVALMADAAIAKGVYANITSVSTNGQEIVLDFVFVEPLPAAPDDQTKRGYLVSRVVMGMQHLTALSELLTKQVEKLKETQGGE